MEKKKRMDDSSGRSKRSTRNGKQSKSKKVKDQSGRKGAKRGGRPLAYLDYPSKAEISGKKQKLTVWREPIRHVTDAHRDEAFFRNFLRLGDACGQNECIRNREYDPFCLCQMETGPTTAFLREPRSTGTPAGLRNLRNTCYMNSYLQTLFHFLPLRRIVYEWRVPQKTAQKQNKVALALRRLFVRLQSTKEHAVDPTDFVKSIGLNANRQQDAQEFSLLFLDLLDYDLAEKQSEEKVQDLFKGRFWSTIKCRDCGKESTREDVFHDFSVHTETVTDLNAGLKVFFADEQIDGYSCGCGDRKTATMKKQLIKLPRFLNIHLNRVVFDRVTQVQKKLSHAVEFPLTLDLRTFVQEEQLQRWGKDACGYELIAVLVHLGDADFGHYFARIRVPTDQRWFTFNDANVTPYAQRDSDADYRGAYLLVYEKQRDVENRPKEPALPKDSREFESANDHTQRFVTLQRSIGNRLDIWLSGLKAQRNSQLMWLPISWLKDFIRSMQSDSVDCVIPPPNVARFLCLHGRLGRIEHLKAVDKAQAQVVLDILNISPIPYTLDGDSFCVECNGGGVQNNDDDWPDDLNDGPSAEEDLYPDE